MDSTISNVYECPKVTHQRDCTLNIYQITFTIWSLLCILVNILFMFLLSARGLKEPLYFILLGLCMSNIMYVGLGLYFGVISFECMSQWTKLSFITSIIVFINLSDMYATFILVENVVRHPKRCYFVISSAWILAFVIAGGAAILVHSSRRITLNLELPLSGVVNLSCILTLCAKVLAKHIRGFNALVSSVTIICTLLVFIPVLVYHYFRYIIPNVLYVSIMMLYAASFTNLFSLIYYNYETRDFILNIFRGKRN